MRIIILLLFVYNSLIISSCKPKTSKNENLNDMINSKNIALKALKHKNDSLFRIESELYSRLSRIKPESPAGFSINYNSSTFGISEILFGKNNQFKIQRGKFHQLLKHNISDDYKIYFVDLYGNWEIKNGSIYLYANLAAGNKFIGNNCPGIAFNEIVDTLIILNWEEIVFNSISRKDKPLQANKSRIIYDDITNLKVINKDTIPGDYPYLSIRMISEEEIRYLPKTQLMIMRNEIFARFGYQFSDSLLINHFNNKHWYKKEFRDCELTKFLNEAEKHNINLIKKYENE